MNLEWLTDPEAVKAELQKRRLTWRHRRDKAGTEGTLAHDIFEKRLGGIHTQTDKLPESVRGYGEAIDDFFLDHPGLETLNTEQVVLSKEHNFAGRFDARVKTPEDGIWLVDVKTSNFLSPGYFLQLAAYDLAAAECGVGGSDRLFILQISNEGKYRLVESHATEDDVLAALHLYNRAKEFKAPKW